ncbi:extracellular solute-binding protein [Fimbriimonas ginsengisoli]|uniref:N-Acetyl-D-glucosamine ABC transport system, permease protein 1 n=1 Tax=Fimbriimonas ginsengisoli Gsoil 348 TaxID=661478 RepID=A0A068NSY4_FIMGI|nr:extracellular solute-binding protein [Fimbriimonas ginsengisoli]AIE84734.1 N-Acetyl-D-glucosamine ABC transport system, permease protein 1 [Fimbriimonas ginsengisoli Gsoil 348]
MRYRCTRLVWVFLAMLLAAVAMGEPIHLRFVCWDGDQDMAGIFAAARQFERAHPNITVKVESVVANYQEKLLAQFASGTAPDVAMMDPANFQKYARRGALLPLNPLFKETPKFRLDDYYPEIVKPHSLHGTLYVLPRDIAPCGIIYYNKKAFSEAGIPFPDGTWTWDFQERPELKEKDFLWVIHHLSRSDALGKVTRWGYAPGWKDLWTYQVFQSTGARIADDYESPKRMRYDDPRIIRAYQFTADLSMKQRWMPSETEINSEMQTNTRQMFTQGKVAMFESGIWEVPQLRNEMKKGTEGYFDWDIAMAPAYKDGTRVFPTGGSGYCIMSSTKHPREAWLLTQWMAGEPGMLELAKSGRAQPAIRRLALSEPWIPGPNTPAEQQVPHNRIVTDQCVPYVLFGPRSPEWPEASGVATAAFGRIYEGTATAKEILPDGNRQGQARLDYLLQQRSLTPFNWTLGALFGALLLGLLGAWVYWPERKIKRTGRQKRESRLAYVFIMPWVLGLLGFTAGPMILSLLMSFADWDIIQPARWRGFGNYVEMATVDPRFWVSLKVTALYTILAVPLGVAMSLALALLLNTKVRGMPLWRTCYFLPTVASGVASALIWKRLFQADGGLINTIIYGSDGHGNFLGLAHMLAPLADVNGRVNWLGSEKTALGSMAVMSIWGAGGGMVILLAGLQGVPQYLYEAATLDGASPWRRFRSVTLPMISPTLFFSLVTGVIGSFQVFQSALVMTNGGPNNATMFYMLHLYLDGFISLRMGYASALAWVLFLIVLVLTGLQFRFSRWVHYEGGLK